MTRPGDKFTGSSRESNRPLQEPVRLNRFLSLAGVCSRRQAMRLVQEGRITVNGKVETDPGRTVLSGRETIRYDGEKVTPPRDWVYYAFNKPRGVVVTADDDLGREGLTPYLRKIRERVFAVGRLDQSSEGLLILTNNGDLANRLLHPRFGIEKVYHVTVQPKPRPWQLARMAEGVHIGFGETSAPAEISVKRGPRRKKAVVLRMILWEGKKREIRRICKAVGLRVLKLRRQRFAGIRLGHLPAGAFRPLFEEEIAQLAELSGLDL